MLLFRSETSFKLDAAAGSSEVESFQHYSYRRDVVPL